MGLFSRIGDYLFGRSQPPIHVRSPKDQRRWPDWISSGMTLDRLGAILRNADQGDLKDLMSLLQEIAAREALVNGLLSVRLSALSQRKIKVVASKSDPDPNRAAQVAAYVQRTLDSLKLARTEGDRVIYERGLSSVVESILMSTYYGLAAGWVYWGHRPTEQTAQPVAIEFFDERRFYLDLPTDSIRLATDAHGSLGPKLSQYDSANILEIRNTRLSKRLPMAGCGRSILISWWLRFGTLKDLTNYLETWGKPGLVINAKENAGYDEDQYENLQTFLQDYMGDTRVLLPPGFEASVLEASQGGEKVFELVDSLTERHLQFAIVGQVGAIAGDSTTYAAGQQAQRVRDDLTDGDARLVAEALEKIGRDAIAVRFGTDCPAPTIEFDQEVSIETMKSRGLAMQAAIYPLTSGLKNGIPINVEEYCDLTGVPLRADGIIDPEFLRNLKRLSDLGLSEGASPSPQQQTRFDADPQNEPPKKLVRLDRRAHFAALDPEKTFVVVDERV